jgi:membrane protein implicated in regulation of membrane protease activity
VNPVLGNCARCLCCSQFPPASFTCLAASPSRSHTGLLCWSAILAFVAALSELSTLQHYAPWLKMGALTKAVLQGLLPVLVMLLFSMLLHWFMDYVARKVEKRKTHSAVQMEIFKW